MKKIIDGQKNTVDYMRVSITDRCNLRCRYCMVDRDIKWIQDESLLTFEEIFTIIKMSVKKGIRKVRLTGGEPLTRKGVIGFIESLKNIKQLDDVSLTTNGILLQEFLDGLYSAGVKSLNISLDTLNPKKFTHITRGGDLSTVLGSIKEAKSKQFLSIKINVVIQKGFNEKEVIDFVNLSIKNHLHIRFIEYMPVHSFLNWTENYFPNDIIKNRIESLYGPLIPKKSLPYAGPSVDFTTARGDGILGFISSISNNFCDRCTKIRLSADGKIYPCLFSKSFVDLKPVIKQGLCEKTIENLFGRAIQIKNTPHNFTSDLTKIKLSAMSSIGG